MTTWVQSMLSRVTSGVRRDANAAWEPGPVMTIVAHPDDDLYFINPGVHTVISAGTPAIGVILAASEGDGRNLDTDDPNRSQAPVDYAGYAAARQVGLRRAYARMAGLPADSAWHRKLVVLDSGFTVEHDILEGAPHVVLYFFNLAHRQGTDGQRHNTLLPLCDGQLEKCPTLPSLDLPAPAQHVSRETVVVAIVELFDRHRPEVVRTLDPDPEHDWGRADFTVSDHGDHTATARLALAAVHRHSETRSTPPAVEYYRAYANRYWARNLSKRLYEEKADYLLTYAGADGLPRPGHEHGHGDYQLGPNPYRSTHIFSTAQRYVATSSWLTRLPSGALAAFAVLGDRLAMWSERHPGSGRWHGPRLTEQSGVMPTLAVAAGPRGAVHVVALRRVEDIAGRVDVEVGYVTTGAKGGLSSWQSLDGPDVGHPDRRQQREIGVPCATVDGDGHLWVFVRDFTGGLSARRQTEDGWQAWQSLGRGPLQDVPVAVTTDAGLVQVYVAAKETVAHWRQVERGGPLVAHHTLKTTPVASGGLHVVRTAGDRACLYFRQAQTGRILTYREHPEPGKWPGKPAELGGHDGIGPIAVIGRRDAGAGDMVMAQRNRFWTVSVAVPPAGTGSRWTRLPGMISGAPSLTTDDRGRAVLAVLGLDGHLHVCRQKQPQPTSAFGEWTAV